MHVYAYCAMHSNADELTNDVNRVHHRAMCLLFGDSFFFCHALNHVPYMRLLRTDFVQQCVYRFMANGATLSLHFNS